MLYEVITGLDIGSGKANAWLKAHDTALEWAKANRALIARRFLDMLGEDGTPRITSYNVCYTKLLRLLAILLFLCLTASARAETAALNLDGQGDYINLGNKGTLRNP